jgi:hypothetical protein
MLLLERTDFQEDGSQSTKSAGALSAIRAVSNTQLRTGVCTCLGVVDLRRTLRACVDHTHVYVLDVRILGARDESA